MPWARESLVELEKCVGGIGRSIYFVFYYIMNYVSWWSKHTCTHTHFELEQDSIFIPICIDTKKALGKYFISLLSSYVFGFPQVSFFINVYSYSHNLTYFSLLCLVCKMPALLSRLRLNLMKDGGNALKTVKSSTVVRCNQYIIIYHSPLHFILCLHIFTLWFLWSFIIY